MAVRQNKQGVIKCRVGMFHRGVIRCANFYFLLCAISLVCAYALGSIYLLILGSLLLLAALTHITGRFHTTSIDADKGIVTMYTGLFFALRVRYPLEAMQNVLVYNQSVREHVVSLSFIDGAYLPLSKSSDLDKVQKQARLIGDVIKKSVLGIPNPCGEPNRNRRKYPIGLSSTGRVYGRIFASIILSISLVAVYFTDAKARLADARAHLVDVATPVVQRAEQMYPQCQSLGRQDLHLADQVLIKTPDTMILWPHDTLSELENIKAHKIKTVVVVRTEDFDWGRISGYVVLLDEGKCFTFAKDSGITEKQIGSRINPYWTLREYLCDMPMQ